MPTRNTLERFGVAVATVVVLSACSDSAKEDGRDRSDAPIGWSTCNRLFGADRIDKLQDEMGKGTLETLNSDYPLEELLSRRVSIARAWEPGSEVHYSNTAHPCDLGIDGTSARFNSFVRWSVDTPKNIDDGVASMDDWKPVGGDVYVLRRDSRLRLLALLPCKVEGTHVDQEAGLPLEIETEVRNVPGFDTDLLSQMTAGLARSLAKRLPCTNSPEIPSVL
ncbi:hypothetical protein ACGFZG_02825 [Streptomyces antibioticus]|uniref:hypothetical protein n=1 Tax=Streptomyces antibioticus TaxID=1890 RepID=UPI0036FEEBFE